LLAQLVLSSLHFFGQFAQLPKGQYDEFCSQPQLLDHPGCLLAPSHQSTPRIAALVHGGVSADSNAETLLILLQQAVNPLQMSGQDGRDPFPFSFVSSANFNDSVQSRLSIEYLS